jgi:uncharacterized membrane protein
MYVSFAARFRRDKSVKAARFMRIFNEVSAQINIEAK